MDEHFTKRVRMRVWLHASEDPVDLSEDILAVTIFILEAVTSAVRIDASHMFPNKWLLIISLRHFNCVFLLFSNFLWGTSEAARNGAKHEWDANNDCKEKTNTSTVHAGLLVNIDQSSWGSIVTSSNISELIWCSSRKGSHTEDSIDQDVDD
jgi:hypothetical protein